MTITWLGHACFLLESGGFRVLIDPFQNVPGLPDTEAEADAVYCSHGHFDHCYTEQIRLSEGKENPFTVEELQTFHDPEGGRLRGENTVRRFTAGGLSVVHLGDLGHPLSEEPVRARAPGGNLHRGRPGGEGCGGPGWGQGGYPHALPLRLLGAGEH